MFASYFAWLLLVPLSVGFAHAETSTCQFELEGRVVTPVLRMPHHLDDPLALDTVLEEID